MTLHQADFYQHSVCCAITPILAWAGLQTLQVHAAQLHLHEVAVTLGFGLRLDLHWDENRAPYLIDKATLGEMCGAYVTDVADVDNGQWHVVTLLWSFKCLSLKLRHDEPDEGRKLLSVTSWRQNVNWRPRSPSLFTSIYPPWLCAETKHIENEKHKHGFIRKLCTWVI